MQEIIKLVAYIPLFIQFQSCSKDVWLNASLIGMLITMSQAVPQKEFMSFDGDFENDVLNHLIQISRNNPKKII